MVRKSRFFSALVIALPLIFNANEVPAQANYAEFQWAIGSPEIQGMSSEKLENLWRSLKKQGTRALVIIRNDHIVFERYSGGFNIKKKHYTASLAKALVGGTSLLVALSDGLIGIDELACKYITQWKADSLK